MGVKALSLKSEINSVSLLKFHNNLVIENGDAYEYDNSIKVSLAVVSIQEQRAY